MKLQDVLLKAMAKKVSSMEAAEIAGVTDRTMRRIRERYQEFGYTGLFDQRRGMRSIHRVPMETAEEVLRLYREVYFDLNIRHFHEKLRDEHAIGLSYTWVQQALQGAGLVAKRAAPAAATAPTNGREDAAYRRQQTPLATGDQWHDLIVILDDATSEIYYAQLVVEESTRTVMEALREVIETRGLFCSLYSDRGSHFFVTQKAGDKVDKHRLTQVGRAMKELGVQMIAAYSPQARGRSERSFGTWQGTSAARASTSASDDGGGRQPVPARPLHREVQRAIRGGGARERHRIPTDEPNGSQLDLHGTDRAGGGEGQHRGDRGSLLADW